MARADDPILVTTARQSPRDEQRDRERRYLLTMGVRVVFFILAIVLFSVGSPWWLVGIAITGSLILPWVAVVVANAGPRREGAGQPRLFHRDRREIGPGGG